MGSSDHLVNFAVAVTGRLATIAPGAGGSDDKLFGPALAAALWLVNQYLGGQQVDSAALKPRLLKLLNNLESICKPPTDSAVPSRSGLSKGANSELQLAHRYPGLSLLRQDNRKNAVNGIRKLASRWNPGEPKTKGEVWVGDDFTGSMRTLYKVLSAYIFCNGDRAKSWAPNTPSMPLSTILRNHKLSTKMRYLLSYLLAKSVWQFYSTDWMGKEWTKDNIHFMYERRQGAKKAGLYLNKPFISARFGSDSGSSTDDSKFRPHKFPRIKTLGVMLLEIELGTVIEDIIEDDYQSECYADGKLNADADLYAFQKLCDDPDRLEDTPWPLKAAIEACLRPTKFMQHRHSAEDLRRVLQEEVPAQQIAQIPHSSLNVPPRPRPPSQLPGIVPMVEHRQVIHPTSVAIHGSVASRIREASSESWFEELDQLNEILSGLPDEIGRAHKRVRVAVIDTGINSSDPYARHIQGYRDFVTNNDDLKQDNTGHGTNSVKLIYKVYAEAEVYVARVFEYDEADDCTQDLMLKAIKHAKDIWQVDVISIASGFERDHALMRRAIKKATSDGVVIFAAASNYGNIRQVTFPARMQDVICMYNTDGRAKASQSINPAAQTTKSKNFAILGAAVSVSPFVKDRG
ncbi:hypothetical protein N3K66_003658 [Trichothecium roseum]|uniref:Uncharacterized protein n=1 Tax=Trichothecium roseum TaxID=47278 RepID=A0ACC0V5Z8_9HYPO|nr:hypothetical protein N3K66_003658 [Trichothecium roseum]